MLAFIAVCVVKAADPATCFFPSSSHRRNLYTPEEREVRFSATYRQPKYYNPPPSGLSRVFRSIARISVIFSYDYALRQQNGITDNSETVPVDRIHATNFGKIRKIIGRHKNFFKYRAIRLDIYFPICYNNTCNETANRFRRDIWRYCTAG